MRLHVKCCLITNAVRLNSSATILQREKYQFSEIQWVVQTNSKSATKLVCNAHLVRVSPAAASHLPLDIPSRARQAGPVEPWVGSKQTGLG